MGDGQDDLGPTMGIPGVSQGEAPCVLHRHHSPITIVNELHHIFPQAWQRSLYEGRVPDQRLISVCATGHNTIHYALNYYARHHRYPPGIRAGTRDYCDQAMDAMEAAMRALGALG